ncbi:MAG TPA: 2-amino-4-hydroxy-6-hydroxymethyldihydropteridine diphosphokinase [Candidatus Binataceae bacterium]|jgi:2-amino-4-hydroxy-6-hydroxymethyldihydropteridine diphosphokinase|nr:2-amino-4-hydroxy-6-hydroxymethyldihydropteridine diphosphokinase [Candidatus Binataceae bacterium]
MPHRAFIGIGTNLGDRLANYHEALERIGKLRQTRIVRQSSIYETEPVGDIIGPFLNGAVEIETEFSAELLMHQLLSIERAMGRKRVRMPKGAARAKYKPRIIDLDLLFFNNELIDTPKLTVPHPRVQERKFVLVPMSELAPALIHPRLNASISELLAGLKSTQRVVLMRADLLRPPSSRREVASR